MASEEKSFEMIVLCAMVLATLVGGTSEARNDRNVADTADVLPAKSVAGRQAADAEPGGYIRNASFRVPR